APERGVELGPIRRRPPGREPGHRRRLRPLRGPPRGSVNVLIDDPRGAAGCRGPSRPNDCRLASPISLQLRIALLAIAPAAEEHSEHPEENEHGAAGVWVPDALIPMPSKG